MLKIRGRVYYILAVWVMLCSAILVTGCSKDGGASAKSLAVVNSFDNEQSIGSLSEDGLEVVMPQGVLGAGSEVTIAVGSGVPTYDKDNMTMEGGALDIKFTGDQRRTDAPILVKIAVDSSYLSGLQELEGIKAVHYGEATGWTYTTPSEINVEQGYVAFEIFNNYLWGTAELTDAERKEQYVKGKALQSWGESQLEGDVQAATKDMIESILVNQFNATNKSEIELVSKAILKELKYGNLEYGKLATDLMKKDFKSYTANVATMIGKTFADAYEAGALSTTFGQLGNAAEAAGYLWEGDYSGAGMKLAETISEMSPAYKVAKVAVDVIDTKINNWKNNGIEEAYKAFKEGSNDYILFGYDNDPQDFNAVWDQMRGLARQIEMDAVKKYAASIGVNVSDLGQKQIDHAKAKAKETLKNQFEKRIVQEAEIAKQEENEREVLAQFEKYGLLERGKAWYPYDQSIERMMDRLYEQINRIQSETGRFGIVYRDGDLHDQARGLNYIGILKEDEMKMSDLAMLIKERYVFGEEAYQKMLKEMGYAKEFVLEAGTYKGTLTIEDAPVLEAAKKALADPASVSTIAESEGEKCEEFDINDEDVQIQLQDAIDRGSAVIGKEVPLTIIVKEGKNKGEFTATMRIDYATAFPDYGCEEATDEPYILSFKDGEITLSNTVVEEDVTMKSVFIGTFEMEGKLKGTFEATTTEVQYSDYNATEVLYSGTWKASK
ncbi:hypothetical protein [Fusibacter bizertensis]